MYCVKKLIHEGVIQISPPPLPPTITRHLFVHPPTVKLAICLSAPEIERNLELIWKMCFLWGAVEKLYALNFKM